MLLDEIAKRFYQKGTRSWPKVEMPAQPYLKGLGSFAATCFTFAAWAQQAGSPPPAKSEAEQIFIKIVQPLFQAKCQPCHGAPRASGLSLGSRRDLLQGGKRGPAIVPGEPSKSVLIAAF